MKNKSIFIILFICLVLELLYIFYKIPFKDFTTRTFVVIVLMILMCIYFYKSILTA